MKLQSTQLLVSEMSWLINKTSVCQARHERKDEGVQICLSCRRPLKISMMMMKANKVRKSYPGEEQTAMFLTLTAKRVTGVAQGI